LSITRIQAEILGKQFLRLLYDMSFMMRLLNLGIYAKTASEAMAFIPEAYGHVFLDYVRKSKNIKNITGYLYAWINSCEKGKYWQLPGNYVDPAKIGKADGGTWMVGKPLDENERAAAIDAGIRDEEHDEEVEVAGDEESREESAESFETVEDESISERIQNLLAVEDAGALVSELMCDRCLWTDKQLWKLLDMNTKVKWLYQHAQQANIGIDRSLLREVLKASVEKAEMFAESTVLLLDFRRAARARR